MAIVTWVTDKLVGWRSGSRGQTRRRDLVRVRQKFDTADEGKMSEAQVT